MIQRITLFDPQDKKVRENVDYILAKAPVKNLNEAEVLTTLRMLYLYTQLADYSYDDTPVVLRTNDARLEFATDEDRFLAMLIECHQQERLLTSKFCMSLFGGKYYRWRRIGRTSPVTAVAAGFNECYTGYYGRGWIIAPHILTLCKWIIRNADFEEYNKLVIDCVV